MTIKEMRHRSGKTQKEFAELLGTSKRTIESWETKTRQCPEYVRYLIEYYLKKEKII